MLPSQSRVVRFLVNRFGSIHSQELMYQISFGMRFLVRASLRRRRGRS